jgi:hypothetical protein
MQILVVMMQHASGLRARLEGLLVYMVFLFLSRPVTNKTHEAAGFSSGFPSAQLEITGSSAEPKCVKTRKTRGFLGYWSGLVNSQLT